MSIDWIPIGSARSIPAKERGNRGFFPSPKIPEGIAEYESCLERDFLLQCHHAPDVSMFQHQPISISYKDKNKKNRIYTPDVYVEFICGKKALFEIKYEEEVIKKSDKYEERWSATEQWSKERNIIFRVITEKNIRTPRWFNIWFTIGASKSRSTQYHIPDLNLLLSENGDITYKEICYNLAERIGIELNKSAQIICYAIYHGLIFVDSFSTRELKNTTIIRKKRKMKESPFLALFQDLGLHLLNPDHKKEGKIKDSNIIGERIGLKELKFRIPLKYEEKVNFRVKIVKSWLRVPNHKRTAEWRFNFCSKWNVSQTTVYDWVKKYNKDGIEGLIPNHCKAGRNSLYNQSALEILEKSRQFYLNPLISQKKAYSMLSELCKEKNIDIPSLNSFKTFIYRNTEQREFAKKRGNKYYKSNFTPSLDSFQGAFAPMQVVQMDNTSFDVFPVDSEYRKQLSTPYMTAAMDCYSRMITGVSLSYFPSSSRTVLDVLTDSILPKEIYSQIYNTEQGWPIKGFPVLLLVDNGMDYRSQLLKEFCLKYDIILEYAPIRTPRYKAFIEQWFNILHKALVDEDVLGFRPLLKYRLENPDLKPEINATLTLQELEQWLYKWILDEYHFTNPYDDYVPAPFLRYSDFHNCRTKIILPLPREPPEELEEIDLLYLSTLEKVERVLSYEGVVWHHLKYNNKELSKVYKRIGNNPIEVLLNPRDIRNVWVIDPSSSIPIKVGLGSGWAQSIAKIHENNPINASAWKMDLKLMKNRFKTKISPYSYQREMSKIKRDELIRMAKIETKSFRKEKEKIKETRDKSISLKIKTSLIEEDTDITAEKEENKNKNIDIDWDNLPTFPVYEFPAKEDY